jgi:hypothetical protein
MGSEEGEPVTTLTKLRTVEGLDHALEDGGVLTINSEHTLKLGDATVYWAAWAKWVRNNLDRVTPTESGYEVAPW